MARPKGFKLSDEQKRRMKEGRERSRLKAREGMIGTEEKKIIKSKAVLVVGYGWSKTELFIYPIFSSEKESYKRKIFKTIEEARASLDRYNSLRGET